MSRLLFSFVIAGALGAGSVWAHHETPGRSHAVATVTIDQQVLAGGEPLAPGTYEIWISGEKPVIDGVTSDLQRVVEFRRDGQVVRTEIAELMPPPQGTSEGTVGTTAAVGSVGTAGRAGMAKAQVQTLRSGEFVRVSIIDGGVRYLIHLPTEALNEPAPQPQPKTRIELPPRPAQP